MKVNFLFSAALVLTWAGTLFNASALQPQTVPFVSVGVKSPAAPSFALPEFSSAGLPVTWEVLVGPATVSGHTITLTGVNGPVTMRGRQAGDAVYDPAPDRYVTFPVDTGGGFLKISAGDTHVTGIKSDGTLWSWGSNTQGQIGDGTTTGHAVPAPVTVPTADPWTDVACGGAHTVARRADGSLWAWGANADGQLGVGNTVDRVFPTRIGTLTSWAGVACGANHTIAWKTDGTLWTWGDNLQGQLGDNTIADRTAPVRVGTASDWVEAAGGSLHTIGRRAGGSLWCWGHNASGQLGDGTTTRRLTPVRVGLDSNWAQVSAGFVFSAARRTNGTLWAWGNNASGQLGQGHRTAASAPQQVGSDTDWAAINCGAACAIGRRTNGYLWAWGDNSAGQLGDGTTADQLLPVQTLEGPWSTLTVGAACVLGVRSGFIWSWGTNDFEQLGLPAGTTAVSAVPPGSRLPAPYPQSAVAPPAAVGVNQIFSPAVTSALPPFPNVLSGPAQVTADGHRLSFAAGGTVQYQVSHPGDSTWQPIAAQNFTLTIVDAIGPVFTAAPGNQFVQLDTPAGTVVNFTATAVDAVTGPATVVCVPPSGSVFPGGVTTVTCTADDGLANFSTHTFTVTVNRPPAVPSFTVSSLPPTLSLTLSATDADDDDTTLSIVTPPANGTVSGTMPNFTFTPSAGFVGTTTLTYKANDGSIDSLPGAVTLEVLNFPPSVDAQSLATSAFAPLPVTLTGSDGNAQSLTFSIVMPPVQGTLSGTPPAMTYTPGVGAEGPDSFTFRAFDGIAFSDPETISILVNDAPSVPARNLTTTEDIALPITLTGSDPNDHTLAFSIVTPPAHGSLSGIGASLTYTPATDYIGPDSFTCQANDGYTDSAPATVSIDVQAANDAPVANPVSVASIPPLNFTLSGSDTENSPLTFAIVTPPATGTLSGTSPNLTFAPAPGFLGPISFTYQANDGTDDSPPALITLDVLNAAPAVEALALITNEDTALPIALTGTDANDQPLMFVILTLPTRGTLTGTSPNFTYTPNPNTFGPDSFTYRANDGLLDSNTTSVSITVQSVNDAPETWFEIFSVNEDATLTVAANRSVLLNDSDLHAGAQAENNNPLTATLADAPAHAASFTLNPNGTFSYLPNPNFYGIDSFTYRAVDALGAASEPETVLIAVRAVNDAPVAAPQSVTTLEDVPRAVHLRSSDVDALFAWNPGPAPHDSDPNFTIVTPPAHGTLSGIAPDLVYTPNANYHGSDSFTFTANDGMTASNVATVTITIQADSDGDQLPDAWELGSFGSMIYNGSSDPDHDGQNNTFELLTGTGPANAGDSLTIEHASPSPTGGVLRLHPVRPGVIYVLESSTDLVAWDRLSENTYEVPGPGALYDERTDVGQRRRCFYKVTVETAP